MVLLALLSVSLLLRFWLAARQLRHLQRLAGQHLEEIAAARHGAARTLFTAGAAIPDVALTLALTLGGGIAWLDRLWCGSPVAAGGLVASVVFATALMRAVLQVGHAVVVEARFDLTHLPIRKTIAAAIRPVLPAVAIAAVAGDALAWLITAAPLAWWLWAALFWATGLIVKARLVPDQPRAGLGIRLAPSTHPLTDPALAPRLAAALVRCGLAGGEIRVTDSPPGTKRANARLVGAGRSRHVEFSDTLLDLLTPAEIESVLVHEAGHWRCHHVVRDLAQRALLGFVGFAALALAMRDPAILWEIAAARPAPAAWLAVAAALAPLAEVLITPLRAHWRREMEYEADAFVARHGDKQALMRALEKLDTANATAHSADPLHARFYSFHPGRTDRMRRLNVVLGGALSTYSQVGHKGDSRGLEE